MAAKSTIAKRYAKALVDTLESNEKALSAQSELEQIVRLFAQDKNLKTFVDSPGFSIEEKWSVFSGILSKASASKEITHFIRVLLDCGRADLLVETAAEFKRVVMEKSGEAEAQIVSAYALTDLELSVVQTNLEKTLGKKLRVTVEVKPELVAGLKVNVDGKTFDASLSAHLDRLQRQLAQAEA